MTEPTTAELITTLARGEGDRQAIVAELRDRGVTAERTTLTPDEHADLLFDLAAL
jgi:hypothetical protein